MERRNLNVFFSIKNMDTDSIGDNWKEMCSFLQSQFGVDVKEAMPLLHPQ